MAMVQLLLGNIGVAGGGMNALRGHSNIRGLTDLGLMSNLIPGYLTLPSEKEVSKAAYLQSRGFKPLRPGQLSYWQNYPKFFVSFLSPCTARKRPRTTISATTGCQSSMSPMTSCEPSS
jgi:formate dehydrogenase major subunit